MNNLNFIDLFSGAGGFLRGFMDAGITPLYSVEFWEPAISTHILNYPDIPIIRQDIRTISDASILNSAKDVDIIIGGPPCQGFSTIGKRLVKDPRNELVFEFIRYVSLLRPKTFLLENVRGLLSTANGEIKECIIREFNNIGYNVRAKVLCAADYGVPQKRFRLFFEGLRSDLNIEPSFPEPTHTPAQYTTVGDAIMDLYGKENLIPNHIPMKHNRIVTSRIACIPEGQGIPTDGLPDELAKGSRSDYSNNVIKNFSHVYKRLSRNLPSTTMVPGHNAFPLHPVANRSLTVREAARLQTFPDDVVFCGSRQNQCIQVGNAVPIRLANALAKHIKTILLNGTDS